jgi:hypothetical protein
LDIYRFSGAVAAAATADGQCCFVIIFQTKIEKNNRKKKSVWEYL